MTPAAQISTIRPYLHTQHQPMAMSERVYGFVRGKRAHTHTHALGTHTHTQQTDTHVPCLCDDFGGDVRWGSTDSVEGAIQQCSQTKVSQLQALSAVCMLVHLDTTQSTGGHTHTHTEVCYSTQTRTQMSLCYVTQTHTHSPLYYITQTHTQLMRGEFPGKQMLPVSHNSP